MKNLLAIITLIFCSCNTSIELPTIDEQKFAEDQNGCSSLRMLMIDQLEEDKELLKGLNQNEIVNVLGKPDQNALYKRSQKFFIYNLTPTDCDSVANFSPRKYLSIRFNATGLAKEIVIYEE